MLLERIIPAKLTVVGYTVTPWWMLMICGHCLVHSW